MPEDMFAEMRSFCNDWSSEVCEINNCMTRAQIAVEALQAREGRDDEAG